MKTSDFVTLKDLRPGILIWATSKAEAEAMRARASSKISRDNMPLMTTVEPGRGLSGQDGWVCRIIAGHGWKD